MKVRIALLLVMLGAGAHTALAQSVGAGEHIDKPRQVRFVWGDHPSLRSGSFRIDFRARFQLDRMWWPSTDASTDDRLDLTRRRVGVEGRVRNALDFQVEHEIAAATPWRDVFIDVHPAATLSIQAGKFKVPFSLDQTTSATSLDFVYRSMAASQLAPGRSRGAMVHGRVHHAVNYEAGVFMDDGDNIAANADPATRSQPTWAGRVAVRPFRGAKSDVGDLQVGAAWTSTDVPMGLSVITADAAARVGHFFSDDLWVQGRRQRVGAEMRWGRGPLSLKGEFMRLQQERRGQSVEDADLPPLRADAWYVSGTWAVTGDNKAHGGDEPSRPVNKVGRGGFELAGRIESLTVGTGAAAGVGSRSPRADVVLRNRNMALTVGANWHANRWLKVQWNLIRERVEDPGQSPVLDHSRFWSHVLRLQVTL